MRQIHQREDQGPQIGIKKFGIDSYRRAQLRHSHSFDFNLQKEQNNIDVSTKRK